MPRLNNLAESLGMEITDFSEGSCVVELTVGEKHLNMGGWHMAGSMPRSGHGNGRHTCFLDFQEEWCATASGHILPQCGRPGDHLTATAEVVRRGRNLAHIEGRLVTGDGKLAATAKGTWAIWEKRGQEQKRLILSRLQGSYSRGVSPQTFMARRDSIMWFMMRIAQLLIGNALLADREPPTGLHT